MTDEVQEAHLRDTTDIWFAAYLKFRGYDLHDYEVIRPGKSKFILSISPDDWKAMKLEFMRHDISKLKQIMEELKDLSY